MKKYIDDDKVYPKIGETTTFKRLEKDKPV